MIVITPPCHKWFHRNSYQKIDIPAQGVWLESVSTLTAWGAFGGYLPSLAQKLTPPFLCCCKINPAKKCLWLQWCCGPKFKAASKVDWESAKLTELPFTLDWTTCYQKEIPHYPCQTQCSGKGHHLSLRLLLLWLDKKLGKVSSQNVEWDYWK